jgi:DNA topoisomerase-1
MVWNEMIDRFYTKFHKDVEDSAQIARADVGAARELGLHPDLGKKIVVRLGRYGAVAQIGITEDGDTPQYANLKTGQRLETITLEDALELFKLPRVVGDFEDKVIKAASGRFGPYLQHDGKFYSLPKGEDPLIVSYDRSLEIIAAKRKADAEKLIKSFEQDPTIQILNGRWGPYLAKEGVNYKIAKTVEATTLTYEDCLNIISTTTPAPSRGKKPAAKASAKAPKPKASDVIPKKAKPKAKAEPLAMAADKKTVVKKVAKAPTLRKPKGE